jgi:hypothetical protein
MPASSRHRLKETAMLATILTVLAVAIAGVLLAAATRPNVFRVRRSAVIAAPPERILPLINDLRQFNTWNPFANKDPAMQMTYHGPESGPGAANDFEGRRAGKGSLTILESAAGTVAMRLLMTAPFACDNTIEFALSIFVNLPIKNMERSKAFFAPRSASPSTRSSPTSRAPAW